MKQRKESLIDGSAFFPSAIQTATKPGDQPAGPLQAAHALSRTCHDRLLESGASWRVRANPLSAVSLMPLSLRLSPPAAPAVCRVVAMLALAAGLGAWGAVLLAPSVQAVGAAAGPMLCSFFVTVQDARGVLVASGACLALSFVLAIALWVSRRRRQARSALAVV